VYTMFVCVKSVCLLCVCMCGCRCGVFFVDGASICCVMCV